MKLYLDDDIASPRLAQHLRSSGHDVQLPRDAGLVGEDDAVHLAYAVRQGRACLTRNYDDFENLHDLVEAVQGHHAGILVVRRDNESGRQPNEGPQHEVKISKSFYIGVYEVTHAHYGKVTGKNPSKFNKDNGGGPDHPVEQISWDDAVAYCKKFSELPEEKKAGRIYRLPSGHQYHLLLWSDTHCGPSQLREGRGRADGKAGAILAQLLGTVRHAWQCLGVGRRFVCRGLLRCQSAKRPLRA